jgi:hypothetical protein
MSYLVGALSAYECCYGLGSLCRFDKSLYLSEEWPSVLSSFFFGRMFFLLTTCF